MTDTRRDLAQIFLSHEGNVSDKWEHYPAIYHRELAALVARNQPMRLLEIGVQNGGSLQVWREYLPKDSRVVGLEIDPRAADLELGDGISVHVADATQPVQLDAALGDQRFDVIVDDGSHVSSDIIATFESCFSRLSDGGVYFIEDLHCSYIAGFGGGLRKDGAAIEYFKALADTLNVDHFEPDARNDLGEQVMAHMRDRGHSIASISFYDSVVVIRKLETPRNGPFRRAITGTHSPLAELDDYLRLLPIDQLRTTLLSSSAFSALSSDMLDYVARARANDIALSTAVDQAAELRDGIEAADMAHAKLKAETAALRDQLLADRSALRQQLRSEKKLQEGVITRARADFETQQLVASTRLIAVESQNAQLLDKSQRREAQLEAELHGLRTSTLWRLLTPVRRVLDVSPDWIKISGRRGVKLAWWTATGQLGSRLRSRRARMATLGNTNTAQDGDIDADGTLPARMEALPKVSANPTSHADVHPAFDAPVPSAPTPDPYSLWRSGSEPGEAGLAFQRRVARNLSPQPTFSVLVPVYRTPIDVFQDMVRSVSEQTYQHWQLCLAIVDEGDLTAELVRVAQEAAQSDPRIEVALLQDNSGISGNSNRALEMVDGEWTVLLDHDDTLSRDALFEIAQAILANPDAGFVYSDKDNVDRYGQNRKGPLLKPQWSPDMMLNANYLTHVCAIRTANLHKIDGWDPATDGAQDWDLFLRAIAAGGSVVHVPKVLYHWRWIETSVAAGGFDAKPYAAQGQLNALQKHLDSAGWPGAHPVFEGPYLRIEWAKPSAPRYTVVSIGADDLEAADLPGIGGAEALGAKGPDLVRAIDTAIRRAHGELIVLVDCRYVPDDERSLEELALPLVNPAIALVGGRVLDPQDRIIDYGTFFRDGRAYPAFRGENRHYFGPAGAVGWYRNAAATSGGALAFSKATWQAVGGFAAFEQTERPDLAFCLEVRRLDLGRLMLNPFALFRSQGEACHFETSAVGPLEADIVSRALPNGDPFLNPHLDPSAEGAPALLLPSLEPSPPPAHDFAAEAHGVASWFDATQDEIRRSIAAVDAMPSGPVRRVIWILPDFEVPFYGGVNTILRAAEHMRSRHDVAIVFVILGGQSASLTRSRIARAFPQLAEQCEIVIRTTTEPFDLGPADAAICTLWTTAYALLRLNGVRRKYYFVQDWEPLFYPAGSLSQIVEATYRFGFHAICNTPSLAESYRALGGSADHFMPSVDPTIFHARGRTERQADEPFVLVSYTRPGTPRNCFEALAEGMRLLKGKYGDGIDIITAGAEWNPAHFGLGGVVRNLGLLPYAETGPLYRSADAGLVAMATRHPSYLPFEWMACGAAVVTNHNPHTRWLLADEENSLLCEMTRSDVFETVSRLIEEPGLRDRLAQQALRDIADGHSDWSATCERIFTILDAGPAGKASTNGNELDAATHDPGK